MKLLVSSILVLILMGVTLAAPATNVSDQLSPEVLAGLASARKATARFHRVEQAEAEGYIKDDEFQQLVDFVRNGLLDRRATPEVLKKQIPKTVPSGFPVLKFQ